MIVFDNWRISVTREVIARQYDNLSRRLEVVGDLPDGWEWALLVQVCDNMDIIPLDPMEGGVGVTLTRDQLALGDVHYNLQLRGTQGDVTRHTNMITTYIPRSISGDGQWPTIPSEFTELEQRVQEDADRAEDAAKRAEEAAGQGSGSGGFGGTIIDVAALPGTDIDSGALYRLITGGVFLEYDQPVAIACQVVNGLPEEPVPIYEGDISDPGTITTYYNTKDGTVYGYASADIAAIAGVTEGWVAQDVLFGTVFAALDNHEDYGGVWLPTEYGGTITVTPQGDTVESAQLLLIYELYFYRDAWIRMRGYDIARPGTGYRAVVLNGENPGAASGEGAVAENFGSAKGHGSHAENAATATGRYSHAEGGENNEASGDYSHVEGMGNEARAEAQHVQGRYALVDDKYAHIQGNGVNANNYSNAHTVDWDGNGWFAGKLRVGGISQDDENSKRVLTEDDLSGLGGGTSFETDETLKLENGVLSVNTADVAEADNTLPITSAAVATQVGNIELILETI